MGVEIYFLFVSFIVFYLVSHPELYLHHIDSVFKLAKRICEYKYEAKLNTLSNMNIPNQLLIGQN